MNEFILGKMFLFDRNTIIASPSDRTIEPKTKINSHFQTASRVPCVCFVAFDFLHLVSVCDHISFAHATKPIETECPQILAAQTEAA